VGEVVVGRDVERGCGMVGECGYSIVGDANGSKERPIEEVVCCER